MVFPGQGSQRPGMGRDFHEAFATARRAFEEASDGAGLDVGAVCFGDDERLGLTEFAQPAIVATEIAMARVLAEELDVHAAFHGGHSLGEYAALVSAGVMSLAAAASTVRERGRLMQEAVPVGAGRMVAVIRDGIDREAVADACRGLAVDIANDNSVDQIVLSGAAGDVEQAETRLMEALAEAAPRIVTLDVSAPFHSRLMRPIEETFADVLAAVGELDAARAGTVTSNFTGGFHAADVDSVRGNLVRQISGTVRWRDNMHALAERCDRVIEVGPGRPLRAFFKTIGVTVESVTSLRAARNAFTRAAP